MASPSEFPQSATPRDAASSGEPAGLFVPGAVSPRPGEAPKSRRTLRGLALRVLGAGSLCALIGFVVVLGQSPAHPPAHGEGSNDASSPPAKDAAPDAAQRDAPLTGRRGDKSMAPQAEANPAEANPAAANPAAADPAAAAAAVAAGGRPTAGGARDETLRAAVERVLPSVVALESLDAAGRGALGAGFVVDARGLVATNFHVMCEATQAVARFQNGVAYEVEGYVAASPERDLALIQLRGAPELQPVTLVGSGDPPSLSTIFAVGHPQGLAFSPEDGRVSRVIATTQLPERSQEFLRHLVSPSSDPLWIQHTAGLAAGSSGGPLVNVRGEVIGVNTWVDTNTRFGYALHARHLQQLLEHARDSEVIPLDRLARAEARVADWMRRLTAQRIRELAAEAAELNWTPVDQQQYETLQQLAWSVTVASLPSTFARSTELDGRMEELLAAVGQLRKQLQRRRWDAIGQLLIVNELAQSRLRQPMEGVVVFARVLRIVQGGGRRGALFKIVGHDDTFFMPLDGSLARLEPGEHYLVLGVNHDGREVRYGDNPLDLITAPVIVSELMLSLPGLSGRPAESEAK